MGLHFFCVVVEFQHENRRNLFFVLIILLSGNRLYDIINVIGFQIMKSHKY